MFRKMKNKFDEKTLQLATLLMQNTNSISAKKGDTQLIVLVLLLAVVAVAVVLFKNQFMNILNTAMLKLGETFNNLFNG